ncbi:ABC transporter permease [Actinocrispum wychmicini]|uniref:Peptide/nickel transport system permease protein n=1 Tax=Actinocrispum wychmicini TaxID=1213861 RepID=A0A4R2J266_9PSEU|nr:ABC transporter permease [Actinocrispum wychmicini]TCO52273.1 peptide/nickel transport system permease protein [Actinocrispum wychmicini]
MRRLIALRVLSTIPLLALVAGFVFLLVHLTPIDPVRQLLGPGSTEDQRAALAAQLGYDRPLLAQFGSWLGSAVRGDFGQSLFTQDNVLQSIVDRLPMTMSLVVGGLFVAVVIGIPAGIVSAVRPGSVGDRAVSLLIAIGLAIPSFWLAMLLALVFAVLLPLLPALGYTPIDEDPVAWFRGMVLPCLALGLPASATIARQLRGALAGALRAPYTQALRARGTPRNRIIYRYGLRNSMVPVLTTIGWELAVMMAVSFVVERVFGFPGTGTLLIDAVVRNDMPVVQGGVMFFAGAVVLVNLLVDIGYGILDPKARPQ